MKTSNGLFRLFAATVVGVIVLIALIYYSYVVTVGILTNHKDDDKKTEVFSFSELEKNNAKQKEEIMSTLAYASDQWETYGGDYYNRRFSTLDQVNLQTISNLQPEWVTSLGSGLEMKYSGEATPIVVDGVMFVATGANDVLALNAKTGEKIWEYRPEIAEKLDTVCCGWTTRGVAVGDGKVYVGLLDARLVALDQKTGKVLWETVVAEWEKGYTITSAPLFYNDKVYTGVSGGEYGIRGRIMAYDADYGYEVWRFYTIPTPYELHGNTWPDDQNKSWLTGGAPVWNTPAVDPELGLIYFATGNTAPDLDGSKREGDNLYANSIVAINAETGKYEWHFQQVHHDIWDLDPANPVILFDVMIDGQPRKGLGQAGKTGWVYFLDRVDGTPLIGIEEKPVPQLAEQKTSPTQPFPIGDAFVPQEVTEEDVKRDLDKDFNGLLGSIFTPFWDEPVTLKPSAQGGANWPPSAYSPKTEYFYVLGNDAYMALSRQDEDIYEEGSMYIGSIMVPVSNAPQRGTVTALDVKTNKIAWQVDWDAVAYSGILATAGDIVFVGHNDGRLIAYDASNGKEVWSYMTDAGVNAPAITYEIDGEQYIAVFAAGNALAGTKHGDKVYTFKIGGAWDGTIINTLQDTSSTTTSEQTGETVAAEPDTIGESIYTANCLACHGNLGANGHNGPNLQLSEFAKNYDNVVDRVTNGGTSMPPFESVLTKEEIDAVAQYITEIIAKLDE